MEVARDIASDLQRTTRSVQMMAVRIGVRKSPEFLRINAECNGFGARSNEVVV